MFYNVLLFGYKNPNPERIRDLLIFERDYLNRNSKTPRRIFINPYRFMKYTEEINEQTLADARKNREEYNLDPAELDTVYDGHSTTTIRIKLD